MPSAVMGTSVVNGLALAVFGTVVNAGGAVDQSIEATPDAGSLAEIVTVGLVCVPTVVAERPADDAGGR